MHHYVHQFGGFRFRPALCNHAANYTTTWCICRSWSWTSLLREKCFDKIALSYCKIEDFCLYKYNTGMSNRQFQKGTWRIFVNCTAAIQFVKKDSLFISCRDFAWYSCYCLVNSISVFQFGCYFSPIYHQGSPEYSVNFTFTLKILGLLLKRFLIL